MSARLQARYRKPLLIVSSALTLLIVVFSILSRDAAIYTDHDTFPVRINEILASNSSYPNAEGILCDWVELYNHADTPVSLAGYKLSDSERVARYIFPSGTVIGAKGYLLVSCSSERADGLYAGFSLSRDGNEPVTLYNRKNVVIDRVVTWPTGKDQPMVRLDDGSWTLGDYATPLFPNTEAGHAAYLNVRYSEASALRISELMAANLTVLPDSDGAYYDWIELVNTAEQTVGLSGFYLSDDVADPYKWALPEGALAPGDCLVVFASGKDLRTNAEWHTGFSLAKSHGSVLLSGPGGLIYDMVEYALLGDNRAYQRQSDGSFEQVFGGTPGSADTGTAHNADGAQQVYISEIMPANGAGLTDADGDWSDWIELTNGGKETVSLRNHWLSADENEPFAYRLPDLSLLPGERRIVFASGKERVIGQELHTGFRLPRTGGAVTLYTPQGQQADALSYPTVEKDQSVARDEIGQDAYVSDTPTPGAENTAAAYAALLSANVAAGPICISEVMPANDRHMAQSVGKTYDFAEICNLSNAPVELGDYYLSNDAAQETMWRFPAYTLMPGERLTVLCSGDTALSAKGFIHASFSLSAERDRLYLLDADGRAADAFPFANIPYGFSYGRGNDGAGLGYLANPTPGEPNGEVCANISAVPTASLPQGVYEGVDTLELALAGEGALYYTLDGSPPTTDSARYTAPIRITKTTVVRAVACRQDALPSRPLTLTYIVNEGHTLPVACLTADPADLFGDERGIYVAGNHPYGNFTQRWERSANLAFFDGGTGFSTDCGVALSGKGSRKSCEKKSFKILFRPRYGQSSVQYKLFEDCDVTEFASLVLRAGEDYRFSIIREELFTSLAADASDALLTQAFRYCVLYVNGEYFGIYCIKERFSKEYFASHFGVSADSVTLLERYASHRQQRTEEFYVVSRMALDGNMQRDEKTFAYVTQLIDTDGMIDWCIFQAFCANTDVGGNVRFFKSADDGKWRYAFFDMDWAFYHRGLGFDKMLGEVAFYNYAVVGLMRNKGMQTRLLQRLDELLSTTLSNENVSARIDELADVIRAEVPRDRARWGRDVEGWEAALGRLKNYLYSQNIRRKLFYALQEAFDLPRAQIRPYLER